MSGSAPPLEFFNPVFFLLLVLMYGCGTLLIREARARWRLQWSIIFLAIAYGIIEEGLMVKSFFNPDWQDIEKLSEYGELMGVQWVWTIMLTIYHATISTLSIFPALHACALTVQGACAVGIQGSGYMPGVGVRSSEFVRCLGYIIR